MGPDDPIAEDDAAACRYVEAAMDSGIVAPVVGLLGGDLGRTVGARADPTRLLSADAVRLPMDLGEVILDGERHLFVAHVLARRSWWFGPVTAVMNAQWLGRWDVAPKSHPGDGLLDVFETDMTFDDRLKARRRLLTGTHVPHPEIRQRRIVDGRFDLERPTPIRIDGRLVGSFKTVEVRVLADAWIAVV